MTTTTDETPGTAGETPLSERTDVWPEQATPELAGPTTTGGERVTIYRNDRRHAVADQGRFRIHFHFPGYLLPAPEDHGHHGLATIAESFLDPDTWIRIHEHRNDEIISWVPAGVMRHDDRTVGPLVTDAGHLMVMNAGESFWHEERTLADDPPLRMLQIFVRPHTTDLAPGIQHGPLPEPVTGQWRHLFGPPAGTAGDHPGAEHDATTDGGMADHTPHPSAPDATGDRAPFTVRNAVHLYDVRLEDGTVTELPHIPGWHTFFHVFEGEALVDGERFGQAQSGLIAEDAPNVPVTANQDTTLVAFLIDPNATVTRIGTVGR